MNCAWNHPNLSDVPYRLGLKGKNTDYCLDHIFPSEEICIMNKDQHIILWPWIFCSCVFLCYQGSYFWRGAKGNVKQQQATFPFKSVETKWNTLQMKTSQVFPFILIVPSTFFPKASPFWNILKSQRMTFPINCQAIQHEQSMCRTYVRLKARVKLSQELFSLPGTCAEIITYTVSNCSVIFVEKHQKDLLSGPIYSQMVPFRKILIYKAMKAFVWCFTSSVAAFSH